MPARPRAVEAATALLLALLAVGAATVVLTLVQRDDLIVTWAQGHREARDILAQQGLAYLKAEQPIAIPQFVPVASVLWVVVSCLALVLVSLFRLGHTWARWGLVAMVALLAIGTGAGLRIGAPTDFEALSWLSLVVDAAVLVALLHPATTRFLRAS